MTQTSSLRRKLISITVLGSVVTALVAAAGFTWWDLSRFWEWTGAEVTALASVVGDQVGPAVVLNDRKAAAEILASLRSDTSIRQAVLYRNDGVCFAEFHREPGGSCPLRGVDGIRREASAIVISRPITSGGDRVGTLLLAANLPSIPAILRQYLQGAVLIVILKLLLAAVLVAILQSRVAGPILAIANVARRMAETHGFGERVRVESTDELGVLASSFNTMLDEIQRRDAELARHREKLEEEVAERSRVNTALHQAKEKAEEAARLKSEFLANMSHEIRTPLNGVTGMISLVLDRCADPEEREQLQVAKDAAMSLTSILNDVLDLSRIEAGKLPIESVAFDLRNTLRECLRLFEVAVREKDLALSMEVAPDCPAWVHGDPARLRQVLVNLVGNAVKFTLEGEVCLSVSAPAAGTVRFDVRDTGIGVPRDKLEAIFEPFTQADGSHTRKFGGSGLGLTITRRLVSLMGGRLWARSEPGRGSVFSVELPLNAAHSDPAHVVLADIPRIDLPELHVLLAEDNLVNQKVTSAILRRQGWTVSIAGDGQQAYRSFLEGRFDLILMDVQMPELDGLQASELIRAEERRRSLPRTPIIAVTAHASPAQHEQCLEHGMDAVVTKPVDLTTLLDAIQKVLTTSTLAG